MSKPQTTLNLSVLKWPARLTLLGLWAERITHAFWPLWSVVLLVWAAVSLGLLGVLSPGMVWLAIGIVVAATIGALVYARRIFHRPSRAEALARIDQTMAGRPITAVLDAQALGHADPASKAIWQAHQARMQARLTQAEAVSPDLRVSKRDPYALRYVALLFCVMSVGFGGLWRGGALGDLSANGVNQALATGPAWEIWIEPPAYTHKPSLYLNDVKQSELEVPMGSTLTVRLYGQVGRLTLIETVSGEITGEAEDGVPQTAFSRKIIQDGVVEIGGDDLAQWQITARADAAPIVMADGDIARKVNGEMELPFKASDDYGVESGTAEITLDLAAVDRRYGLVIAPEARAPVALDLPMPISAGRDDFQEALIENLSQHPWASLPVSIDLVVHDSQKQASTPTQITTTLPGRRFFQPIAKALIEQRRDLLWSRKNAGRVSQVLRALTYKPEGFFSSEVAYLTTRMAITRLELAAEFGISDEKQEEVAQMLWQAATLLEDGRLEDARERLKRAQERLSDALKEGATSEEIAELMQELDEAMQQYMDQLAQEGQEGDQQQADSGDGQEITGDQLQAMLDEIQRLIEAGETDQAQRLLDQLMEMMENMKITQSEGGQGRQSPGAQAMDGLQDSLREQQGLSDEAFKDLQEQYNPSKNGDPGSEGREGDEGGEEGQSQEGQEPGQDGGASSQGEKGSGQGSLADRQQALRDELSRQEGAMPGRGTPQGDTARDAIGRAGDAMERAEDALRDGDVADALGAQSDAMEALREGMRDLGEAMAQKRQEGQGEQEQQNGQASGTGRDPLGREQGSGGAVGSDDALSRGEAAQRRARDLLDEIRRRSGELERPNLERDYLKRLLDQF